MICTGIHNVSVTFLKAISFIFRFKLLNSSQNLNLKIDFLTSDLPSLESLVFYFLQRYFYTADNKLNSAFSIQHSAFSIQHSAFSIQHQNTLTQKIHIFCIILWLD
ncbi:hypothetical protein AZH43_14795 [Acinetobacter pragensis]|uniref:Uncharacterized protein n=1 Tax=Acinetobacter pragensis TaxID=1806892 RepID=A0A151Y014_9GAMM|nr:hypothetical protein AZH43_14795 [Acinetobacter pragensis]